MVSIRPSVTKRIRVPDSAVLCGEVIGAVPDVTGAGPRTCGHDQGQSVEPGLRGDVTPRPTCRPVAWADNDTPKLASRAVLIIGPAPRAVQRNGKIRRRSIGYAAGRVSRWPAWMVFGLPPSRSR